MRLHIRNALVSYISYDYNKANELFTYSICFSKNLALTGRFVLQNVSFQNTISTYAKHNLDRNLFYFR